MSVAVLSPSSRRTVAARRPALPWISVTPGYPYFCTDTGEDWTPIGQNDAITWPELRGLFRRRDTASAERYLDLLAASGVTVLRLMLEYCHGENRYFENSRGEFVPNMVRLWDDLFAMCERRGLRILLTPFDTFWMWMRWQRHPFSEARGGPCPTPARLLVCPAVRARIKRRLLFCVERWGGSGALFAWDLWNEIHSSHAEDDAGHFTSFIADLSETVRAAELRLYGRTHPQTVSVFGPHLESDPRIGEAIYRHPALDFASTHFYEQGTIDDPRDTVAAALSTGRLTQTALAEVPPGRPFFDSEHGPIHRFKDHRVTLPEAFDDEYFRHMQWAHFASGGAGGGMRWPNRHPHSLTLGMRRAQRALADFLPLLNWQTFRRRNLTAELRTTPGGISAMACGGDHQAVVWLLRTDSVGPDGRLLQDASSIAPVIRIPGLNPGSYSVTAWDTDKGRPLAEFEAQTFREGMLVVQVPAFVRDLALAIRPTADR